MPSRYSASCSGRIPAFACEGKLAPRLKSFESKVCHAPSWQAGARQRYREASVPVEGENYPTHPGRPALARAGEERLHRQKSNYGEFYRQKGVCLAGNSLGRPENEKKPKISARRGVFSSAIGRDSFKSLHLPLQPLLSLQSLPLLFRYERKVVLGKQPNCRFC